MSDSNEVITDPKLEKRARRRFSVAERKRLSEYRNYNRPICRFPAIAGAAPALRSALVGAAESRQRHGFRQTRRAQSGLAAQ